MTSATTIFALADSEGHISLYEWRDNKVSFKRSFIHEVRQLGQMQLVDSVDCAPSDVLCLSLDWSNRRFPSSQVLCCERIAIPFDILL